MLKIGFVYHHLNNYHANVFLKLLREDLAAEDAQVVAAWESDPTGEDWCEKNGVPRAGSIAEVLQVSDAIVLLAPDNIDTHLALSQVVLPAGKPTFIDKMLSTTSSDAKQIVQLSEKHGAPIFATSALRFASEMQAIIPELTAQPSEAFARGMGKLHGYGIHTLTLVQWMMGTGVQRLIDTGTSDCRVLTLDYGGRIAVVEVRQGFSTWDFGAKVDDRYFTEIVKDYAGFYRNQMQAAVQFFRTGNPPVSVEESLEAIAIHEAADRSQNQGRVWVDI
jgi:predicted dehydrogenase